MKRSGSDLRRTGAARRAWCAPGNGRHAALRGLCHVPARAAARPCILWQVGGRAARRPARAAHTWMVMASSANTRIRCASIDTRNAAKPLVLMKRSWEMIEWVGGTRWAGGRAGGRAGKLGVLQRQGLGQGARAPPRCLHPPHCTHGFGTACSACTAAAAYRSDLAALAAGQHLGEVAGAWLHTPRHAHSRNAANSTHTPATRRHNNRAARPRTLVR